MVFCRDSCSKLIHPLISFPVYFHPLLHKFLPLSLSSPSFWRCLEALGVRLIQGLRAVRVHAGGTAGSYPAAVSHCMCGQTHSQKYCCWQLPLPHMESLVLTPTCWRDETGFFHFFLPVTKGKIHPKGTSGRGVFRMKSPVSQNFFFPLFRFYFCQFSQRYTWKKVAPHLSRPKETNC